MTRTLRRIWQRLLSSWLHRTGDADLAEEFESHIRLLAEDDIRLGTAPGEAYRRARLRFGNVESMKEIYRDQRGVPALETTLQDLRYAFRWIGKNRGFAAVAILSLAVGIGANTAIFSVVNAVLLQPLAYKEPQRVFAARELRNRFLSRPIPVNPAHAREWARQCPSLEDVALMRGIEAQVISGGEPVSVPGLDVPHNLFALFGVEPILGRSFVAGEEREGNDRVVILSESLWRSRFNADSAVIGRSIRIDGENVAVVGVVPSRFRPAYDSADTRFEIYRPLVITPAEESRIMGNFNYAAAVRLRPGATAEQALAEMNVVEAQFPRMAGTDEELKATLIPAHELLTGRSQTGLWMLAAAVGAVLLIVCLNLANLLLSRMAARRREAVIRTALGASRGRQFRQAFTESMLLAVIGGLVGILFAGVLVRLLGATTTLEIPRLDEVRIDLNVLVFGFSITLLTGILFGSFPAWRLTCANPQEALHAGSRSVTEGRRGIRLREGLISLEVGLSTALLIVAGLLAASLTQLLHVDKGFDLDHVLTLDVRLAGNVYSEAAERGKFFDRLFSRIGAIPGVQAAGFVTALPAQGETWLDPIYLEETGERESERHSVNNRYASPGYFRAMNIALRNGRFFDESDRDRSVAVLSSKAARLLWPGDANPVGRRFMGEDDKVKTLVGVVADVRANIDRDPPPTAYYPYWQREPAGGSLVVRTTADPDSVARAVRSAVRSEDAQLAVPNVRTMDEVVGTSVAQRRFQLTLMALFAASSLLVAGLGIYGVVSYSVARRRNEIGIRMALGAPRARVLGWIVRQGMKPVLIGLAAGIGAALLFGQTVRGLLFEIQPGDPVTISAVVAVLLIVGALACFIPASRAAATDIADALRMD